MNAALLRVMYAPVEYIHQDHFPTPEIALTPAMQQAINNSLIRTFSLSTQLDFSLQASDFSQRLVRDWDLIKQAAWLLGCKLARGSMVMSGQLSRLPVHARRFIELPIACPSLVLGAPISQGRLENHGARYLYLLRNNLPHALGQRLPLMFSSVEQNAHQGIILNRSLLTFAFDYAQNTSY